MGRHTNSDEVQIILHCEKLRAVGLNQRKKLKENIVWANREQVSQAQDTLLVRENAGKKFFTDKANYIKKIMMFLSPKIN